MPAGKADQHGDARDKQAGDEREEDAQRPGRPARDGERRDERPAAEPSPTADRNLRRLRRETGELGDAHEPEAPRLEIGDQPPERRNGLRAVAAAVVQQDHAAAGADRCRGAHDLVHARLAPVFPVEVGERDHVSLLGEPGERGRLVAGQRCRHRGVGRANQAGTDADDSGDGILGQRDLERALPARDRRELDVRERVVAELEAFPVQGAQNVGVADGLAADDEEGGRDVEPPQRRRDARCPARIGPVVEAQRNAVPR